MRRDRWYIATGRAHANIFDRKGGAHAPSGGGAGAVGLCELNRARELELLVNVAPPQS